MTQPQGPIPTARRISVVGSTGSGKTYLARELSQVLGLPHHELDELRREHLTPSGTGPEFTAAVSQLVARQSWVIDGHYRDVRHLIWGSADLVVHLNYSPLLIFWRLLARYSGKRFGKRDAAGSAGGDSPSAGWRRRLSRVFKTVRERREYSRIFAQEVYRELPIVELTSPLAARRWLDGLGSDRTGDGSVRTA